MLVAGSIVFSIASSQWVVAQAPAEIVRFEERHRGLRRDFRQAFDPERLERWSGGWQRADAYGAAVVPVLWDLLRQARARKERLLLIAACAVAERDRVGSRFVEGEWLVRARRTEQVLALLGLATAARRVGDGAAVARLIAGERDAVVLVAGCLALRSFEGAAPVAPEFLLPAARRADAGLVAAVASIGAPVDAAVIAPWMAREDSPSRRDLVRRGCFLGGGAPAVREWVLEALGETEEASLPARVAAALWAAERSEVDGLIGALRRPEPEIVAALGAGPAGRRAVAARGWVRGVPPVRCAPILRGRVAVLRALTVGAAELPEFAKTWSGARELHGAVCLALAWRRSHGDRSLPAGPWLQAFANADEHAWLRLVYETQPTAEVRFSDDALQRAWVLAQGGDLTSAVIARELEDELWRRELHPRRLAYQARVELLSDLLLRGSAHGQARLGDTERFAYLPAGIPADDTLFYPVAFEFFRFVTTTTRRPPHEYRLRW